MIACGSWLVGTTPIKVLLVEDEEAHVELIRRAFDGQEGQFGLKVAPNITLAHRLLESYRPDIVMVDFMLPDGMGMELVAYCANRLDMPVLMLTSHGNEQVAVDAMKNGAIDYLVKSNEVLADCPHIARRALREWYYIKQHKQISDSLQLSEERFRNLFETTKDSIFVVDQETLQIIDVNPAACALYGYTREELLKMKNTDVSAEPGKTVAAVKESSTDVPLRFHRKKDGTVFPVEITGGYFEQGGKKIHTAFIRDITERQQAEEKLKASLAEKEILLREINHRVKNNLQMICSLLDLQVAGLSDFAARSALYDSKDRIQTIARAHEHLYQSEVTGRIQMADYLRRLVLYSHQTYRLAGVEIKFELEEMAMPLDLAIPCGLMVNELASNAFKHAFGDGRKGSLVIGMAESERGTVLSVKDDGVGLPKNFDVNGARSLGLRLVNLMVKQIKGRLDMAGPPGTEFRIILPAGD